MVGEQGRDPGDAQQVACQDHLESDDDDDNCNNTNNKTRLFAGMEAPTVILITKTLGTNETAVRSGMLRAVAKLIVITDSADSNIKNIEQHFDVTRMTDFNSIPDSDDEL